MPALVVQVGATQLRYQLRGIEDLRAMLLEHGDWMPPATTGCARSDAGRAHDVIPC
jgi:hypothetical protein